MLSETIVTRAGSFIIKKGLTFNFIENIFCKHNRYFKLLAQKLLTYLGKAGIYILNNFHLNLY